MKSTPETGPPDWAVTSKHSGLHRLIEALREYRYLLRRPFVSAPPLAATHVLIGWFKDEAHLTWVMTSNLYYFRMDVECGSLRLKPEVCGALNSGVVPFPELGACYFLNIAAILL